MKFISKVLQLFQLEYPDLVERIEKDVYTFLEEMIIQRNISLNTEINYKSTEFRDILHVMVDQISAGLELIGLEKSEIEKKFKSKYGYFKTLINLKTYSDWLYKEFNESINELLFEKILNYFTNQENNLVTKMINLGLLEDDIKIKFNSISNNYPNLTKYLKVILELENNIKNIFFNNTKLEELVRSIDTNQNNLNFIYFGLLLGEYFDYINNLNLDFLRSIITDKYKNCLNVQQNYSIYNPPNLYKIPYIAKKINLNIDDSFLKNLLKTELTNLMSNFSFPLYNNPFYLYYLIKVMNLLNLKPSAKFLDTVISKDPQSISINNLRKLKTEEICYISKTLKEIGLKSELSIDVVSNINSILNERSKEGLFFNDDNKNNIEIPAICSALLYFIETNQFTKLNIENCLKYFFEFIPQTIPEINSFNANQLSLVYYIVEILDLFDKSYNNLISNGIQKFLFKKTEDVIQESTEIQKPIKESLIQTEDKIKTEQISDINITTTMSIQNKDQTEIELKPSIESIKEVKFEQKYEEEPLSNSPKDIIIYLLTPPSLSDDFIENIKINYKALRNPPKLIFDNIKTIFLFVFIEKILKIPHLYDINQIDKFLKTFWRGKGFGITHVPDVESTYYTLFIYDEYKAIDKINISEIHEFLLGELNFFEPYKIFETKYILLSLKLLEKYEFKMMKYEIILKQLLNNDYIKTENFDPLLDTFNLILEIKLLDLTTNTNAIEKEFLNKFLIEVETSDLINDSIMDSAKAIITLGLIDRLNEYKKYVEKLINNIIKNIYIFNENTEIDNISWGNNIFGLELELNIAFWTLLALSIYKPYKTNKINKHLCPKCLSIYQLIPKFCNKCGTKF